MKKNIILFMCAIFLFACSQPKVDTAKEKKDIMQADKDMSFVASQQGFLKALLQYADTDVVKLGEGQLPIVGKKAFKDFVGEKSGTKSLTWLPADGQVAQSGELGYTWGNWTMKIEGDTTLYGNYFTVWKKQADGSWKFALDGGNNSPAPSTN